MSKVVELLRDKACYYLDHTCETIDKSLIHVPSPDTIDKIWIDSDRSIRVLNSLQNVVGTWPPGKYRLCVYTSCRSGHRTYCRSIICSQSDLFRSGEYRKISDRGWLQRSRFYVRHTRVSRTKICS